MLEVAAAAMFLLAVAKEPLIALGSKPGTVPRYHGLMYALWAGAMLCGVLVALSIVVGAEVPPGAAWVRSDPGPVLAVASLAVLVGATVMELGARYQLGKDFSIGAAAPTELASRGLYRLENPIYDALALQALAFGLWWLPLSLLAVAMQLMLSAGGVRGERATIEREFGRYNRGWDSRMWDGLVAIHARLERLLPPPR